jgi:hypothetical protein
MAPAFATTFASSFIPFRRTKKAPVLKEGFGWQSRAQSQ